MCRKVLCPKCNKWTWQGCGQHVQTVLAGIPPSNICTCSR